MGVVLKLVSVEVMVGVVLICGILFLKLLTDCWLCWMKKFFYNSCLRKGCFGILGLVIIRSGIGAGFGFQTLNYFMEA